MCKMERRSVNANVMPPCTRLPRFRYFLPPILPNRALLQLGAAIFSLVMSGPCSILTCLYLPTAKLTRFG